MLRKIAKNPLSLIWLQQWINTAVFCLFYILEEWVFLVTKASFLSSIKWGQKLLVLLKGYLLLTSVCFLILFLLGLISFILPQKIRRIVLQVSNLLPAGILACLLLLMVDNFTYTVFSIGIVSSTGIFRIIYAVFFLAILYFCFKFSSLLLTLKIRHASSKLVVIAAILIGTIFVIPSSKPTLDLGTVSTSSNKLPNVIIIGSDGVLADHMSVYGYERETTPNLEQFAKDALFVENDFPNSGNTSGAIISMFTSKYPTETRVLYPPDMLTGEDAVQHLPGILKKLGYYNVELGAPYYADSYSLGVLNGFDEVNGEVAARQTYLRLVGLGFSTNDAYFLSSNIDRIQERLLHIFFIETMVNPYDLIKKDATLIPDNEKIDKILSLINSSQDQPVFIHAHLMGTHGSRFNPAIRVFSKGETQNKGWMTDFYDDSIYNFDSMFGRMIEGLKSSGQLENTLIVVYSDHGQLFKVNTKIPLIIRFPNGDYKNIKINQAQNLDIAPTILDYLQIEKPTWMEGNSLIDPKYTPEPTIGVGIIHTVSSEEGGFVQDASYLKPPFYQFEYIDVVNCQKWYRLDLYGYKITSGTVADYMDPCPANKLISMAQVKNEFSEILKNDGFIIPPQLSTILGSRN